MADEQKKYTAEEVTVLRDRVKYEDQLLNSRTSIVLTLNGLMAVAASFSLPDNTKIIIACIIIIVDVFWIVCSLDAKHYASNLTALIMQSEHIPIDEAIRAELQKHRFRIGSTSFISVVIPALLLVGWALGLLTAIMIS